jgi:hypothetical protein
MVCKKCRKQISKGDYFTELTTNKDERFFYCQPCTYEVWKKELEQVAAAARSVN